MFLNLLNDNFLYDTVDTSTSAPEKTVTQPEPKTEPDQKTAEPAEKTFNQAEVDRIIKERLDRAEKKAEEKAQTERKEAEEKALEEQQEFKKLADSRAVDLEELTAEAATTTATLETTTAELDQYKEALGAILEKQREGVDESVIVLLDKLPQLEQVAWLNENATPAVKTSVPSTPRAQKVTVNSSEEAAQEQRTFIRNKF